jgi:hypothetical protein
MLYIIYKYNIISLFFYSLSFITMPLMLEGMGASSTHYAVLKPPPRKGGVRGTFGSLKK